jgi:hypothetical protein
MGVLLPRRTRPAARLQLPGTTPIDVLVCGEVDGAVELELDPASALGGRVLHRRHGTLVREGRSQEVLLVAVHDERGRLAEHRVHAVWARSGVQRRAFVRVPAFRPVTLRPQVPGGGRPGLLRSVTRDVSAGGALLGGEATTDLFEGEWLELALELDDRDPDAVLRAGARVVRAGTLQDPTAALALDGLTGTERERLVRWVRARERDAALRLRRDAA